MYDKLVIGIDESYTNTGISIAADNKLLLVKSTNYYKSLTKNNKTEKRNFIKKLLKNILDKNIHKAKETIIIVERMRSNSSNNSHSGSIKYIKATAALIATIVDTAYEYNIPVYSVDTRSWKKQIVGNTKPKVNTLGIEPKKYPTIEFIQKLGFDVSYKTKTGKIKYDDDAADSGCIALYGFSKIQNLKLEE